MKIEIETTVFEALINHLAKGIFDEDWSEIRYVNSEMLEIFHKAHSSKKR